MKKVIITGAGSYIGTAVENWLKKTGEYCIETVNMIGTDPATINFAGTDTVFHVAGIAHIKETKENAHLYYEINRDLAVKTAEAAKAGGVKQFIILSSMSVYGMNHGEITKRTEPSPVTHYGKAKYEADLKIHELECETFKVCTLRPPMVYGKGCKGNYQSLRKLAMKTPVFPSVKNQRSMLYIENLCAFVENLIRYEKSGLFFPQNKEYVCTADMVFKIAGAHGHKVHLVSVFNPFTKITGIRVIEKVFGSLIYVDEEDRCDTVESFRDTIIRTER